MLWALVSLFGVSYTSTFAPGAVPDHLDVQLCLSRSSLVDCATTPPSTLTGVTLLDSPNCWSKVAMVFVEIGKGSDGDGLSAVFPLAE